MFPLPRVPFWYRFFEPQPYIYIYNSGKVDFHDFCVNPPRPLAEEKGSLGMSQAKPPAPREKFTMPTQGT